MAKLRGRRSVSYTRVSTNSEEQRTSIESQKAYYADKFNMKGYEVAQTGAICSTRGAVTLTQNGIYADATDIIGLKQNPTNGRRFSPIFLCIGHFSE